MTFAASSGYSKFFAFSSIFVWKSKKRVTSSNPRVTSSNSQVISSNTPTTSSNPLVTSSDLQAWVEAIKPRVK